jgi:serine protease Do
VTNAHVVQNAKTITVILNGGETVFPAKIVGLDCRRDLAVISIEAYGLKEIETGERYSCRVGECVLTLGNAQTGITAKDGIISQLGVNLQNNTDQAPNNLIETSAIINPGFSGGPLVNMKGEIIGIESRKQEMIGIEGMGYAINIQDALPYINVLISSGHVPGPCAGLSGQDIDRATQNQYKLELNTGVFVKSVNKDGPADKAGILPKDVIVAINDEDVVSSKKYVQVIDSWNVGDTISFTFYRGSDRRTVDVTLVQRLDCP